jgi:hypothetical protein
MARMLSRVRGSQCPDCAAPPDVDCRDRGKAKRTMKRVEDRQWRRQAEEDIEDAYRAYIEWVIGPRS